MAGQFGLCCILDVVQQLMVTSEKHGLFYACVNGCMWAIPIVSAFVQPAAKSVATYTNKIYVAERFLISLLFHLYCKFAIDVDYRFEVLWIPDSKCRLRTAAVDGLATKSLFEP